MVIQYDDPYHHPQTEQLSLLTLKSRVVLTAENEGGREVERGRERRLGPNHTYTNQTDIAKKEHVTGNDG